MTGSGTLADPYVIWDVNDLQNVNLDLTAYYELGQDIDASATAGWNGGLGFIPIGAWVNWGAVVPPSPAVKCAGVWWKCTPFTGHFDGRGFSITGLTINRTDITSTCPDYYYVGLFRDASGADIRNVPLVNCSIAGYADVGALLGMVEASSDITVCSSSGTVDGTGDDVGGLIGFMYDYAAGTVNHLSSSAAVSGNDRVGGLVGSPYGVDFEDCYATGNVVGADDDIGGLVGYPTDCSLLRCYATGDVSGDEDIGGLCGELTTSTVSQCYATGDVSGRGFVGGLAGYGDATFDECFATGDVTATEDYVGGLIGYADLAVANCYARGAVHGDGSGGGIGGLIGENNDTVDNCYSTGAVTGVANLGGLIGISWAAVTDSFWDTETSGMSTSDGGTGKTTAEMKTKSTFTDAGWDFVAIWDIFAHCNDGYPCLRGITPSCVGQLEINKAHALSREEL